MYDQQSLAPDAALLGMPPRASSPREGDSIFEDAQTVHFPSGNVPVLSANTVVVGTGAAGYCAADRLVQFGQRDVLVIADERRAGSSRNAGSDRQTYYKLALAGGGADSVAQMARTLFAGGAMDGDVALAEAALSSRAFFHLVELGVPFPQNRFGEFVGEKTDHDPRQRATSVGPDTSRTMVERLEAKVRADGTRVVEGLRVVDLVVRAGAVVGLVCLRRDVPAGAGTSRFALVRAANVVYATGAPAGMYARSAFPHGQWGATGAALRAGARAKNVTEWQFGLASIAPRWNVCGAYMQVLPTFYSTDRAGGERRDFLSEAIGDYGRQLSLIFLKGCERPFDIRKARDSSSLIDLLVYRETALRGRRVFLDFRRNPLRERVEWGRLAPEAREYLQRAGALFGTPVERLRHVNEPAYELYREKNPYVDLEREPLEVDVCVQHNNGGLLVDRWWRSNLVGLFPVGEAAGNHGVYRPGGAALNSTQVGATRAARYIAARRRGAPEALEDFARDATGVVARAREFLSGCERRQARGAPERTGDLLAEAQRRMSAEAGLVRSRASVERMRAWAGHTLTELPRTLAVDAGSRRSADRAFLLRDVLTTQYVYLAAMADYLDHGGRSRGSALYTDPAGDLPRVGYGKHARDAVAGLPEAFRFRQDGGALDAVVQEVDYHEPTPVPTSTHEGEEGEKGGDARPAGAGTVTFRWRPARPIPATEGDVFENVWRDYRRDGNVD